MSAKTKMSDIVERLRECAKDRETLIDTQFALEDAADEIERLRASIADYEKSHDVWVKSAVEVERKAILDIVAACEMHAAGNITLTKAFQDQQLQHTYEIGQRDAARSLMKSIKAREKWK
jgi:hypothetical protein